MNHKLSFQHQNFTQKMAVRLKEKIS